MGWELMPEPGLLIAEFPKVGDGHRARSAFHPFGPGGSGPALTFGPARGIPCSVRDLARHPPQLWLGTSRAQAAPRTAGPTALLTSLLTNSLCKRFSFTCFSFQ